LGHTEGLHGSALRHSFEELVQEFQIRTGLVCDSRAPRRAKRIAPVAENVVELSGVHKGCAVYARKNGCQARSCDFLRARDKRETPIK
jgi:hypothetical protein